MSLDVAAVRAQRPGQPLHWHRQIDSTMRVAEELAEAGSPAGTVVGADEQTAGRGRFGRHWLSAADAGLYVSLVLRPRLSAEEWPLMTLALGLAAAEAVRQTADLAADLRWPNDVLVGGKKCAGILVQWRAQALIAGLGINVNHDAFPPELQATATSLRLAAGRRLSRETLLLHLLEQIERFTNLLEQEGKDTILRLFGQASSYVRGRRVIVDQENQSLHGTTDGLDETGFLWLRQENGQRVKVLAGGVRPA